MPGKSAALSRSLEDYLEAVADLIRQGRAARVRDIASRLGVGMPSVSVALRALAQRGLVKYDPYELVELTPNGKLVARDIESRHQGLEQFLSGVLGLPAAQAQANACRMEHAIDSTVLRRIKALTRHLQGCERMAGVRGAVLKTCGACQSGTAAPPRPRAKRGTP